MAKVLSGRLKGRRLKIVSIKGAWATMETLDTVKLSMLYPDEPERDVILQHYRNSKTFSKYYQYDHFEATNTFKKRK